MDTQCTLGTAVFAYDRIDWTGMTEEETFLTQGGILAVAFLALPLISCLASM